MEQHFLYWWNVENLFDTFDSPRRPSWLQKKLKSELRDWTKQVLDQKIANLAGIVKQFNARKGPDILGICEVENEYVVQLLADAISNATGRNYTVLHHDTKDSRGIDIAYIYDDGKYDTVGKLFSLEIMKRAATRDILQMTFKGKKTGSHEITLLGNHWPSRTGGQYETEPYRMMVGETESYWLERIREEKGDDHPVVLMGDFNDEPFNRSMTEYLLGSGNKTKVLNARNPMVFNLMYSLLGKQQATHVYGSETAILDQFLISGSIISNSSKYPFKVDKTEIMIYPGMVKGRYNTPVRFGRPSSHDYNPVGFSDHLPISLVLNEKLAT